jgi:hypothetical protein
MFCIANMAGNMVYFVLDNGTDITKYMDTDS